MGDQTVASGVLKLFLVKAKPYFLMVALQCGAAGMYIISEVTLKQGMSRYVLVVYRNAIAALTIAPFALILERKSRPKMTRSTFLRILVMAILEPVLDQNFGYLTLKLTSASFVSAVMNAVPAVTFAIAVICRLEQVKIRDGRSQAKMIGTLVTFAGAIILTLYKGPVIHLFWSPKTSHFVPSTAHSSDKHWLTGTICILVACVACSCFYVMQGLTLGCVGLYFVSCMWWVQSITLKKYPAELSLALWTCLMGAGFNAALTFAAENHHPGVWSIGWDSRLLASAYSGIVSSGITYYVQGLVMKTRGPVFVSAFNPLCMIVVAILGSIILAEKLHLGSIVGAIIIVVGLYAVVWGKSKDSPMPLMSGDQYGAQELPITTGVGTATENSKDKLAESLYN